MLCFDANSWNSASGFVDHVIKAKFQADSVIIGRVVMQETLMVMSNDVDMSIMDGNCCIRITEFTGKSHTIVSTCHDTLLQAFGLLSHESKQHCAISNDKHPVFEPFSCRKEGVLIAVALGCDVLVKGAPGVGPSMVEKILQSFKDERMVAETTNILETQCESNI